MRKGRAMSRGQWSTVGTVVGIVAAVLGLLLVGFFILMAIALNSWGSNK